MHQHNQARLGAAASDKALQINDPEVHADHLQLYRDVMQTVGEAAQTFAAVLRLAKRAGNRLQTFASVERICAISLVPRRTTQVHLRKLCDAQWLEHGGRELLPLNTFRRRRTVTYAVNSHRLGEKPLFAMLPRAFADPRQPLFKSWANRAVLATMVSQDMLPEMVEMQSYGCLDGRELMRTTTISKITGLCQKTVLRAVNELAWHKLVLLYEEDASYQKTLLVGLNRELMVKASIVPERVAGRESPPLVRRRPREPQAQETSKRPSDFWASSDSAHDGPRSQNQRRARSPRPRPDGNSCAGGEENPALAPGQSCADAGTKLRGGKEKPALLISKNRLVRSPGKNPLKETLGQNVPRRHAADRIFVDVSQDAFLADELFDLMGYSGTDGAIVWKACAWHRLSLGPSRADLVSAANGAKECRARSPIAYFRQILVERLGVARFNRLVRRTRALPTGDWGRSTACPERRLNRSGSVEQLASVLARSPILCALAPDCEFESAAKTQEAAILQ